MATTNIELDIENITGVSDADDQYIKTAQKFVVSSIPKELMLWAGTTTAVGSHGGDSDPTAITLPQPTDNIIDVQRNGFSAKQVPESMQGFIANSSSLHLATETYPKYYMQAGNKVIVKPDPSDSETALVNYVDFLKVDDDCDLRGAVIFHAAAQEFEKIATGKTVDWSDLAIPVAPTSPSFTYTDASVSDIVQPIVSISDMASMDVSAPSYVEPVLTLGAAPTITDLSIAAVPPDVPSLTAVTFVSLDSDIDASLPTYTFTALASSSTYTGSAPSYSKPILSLSTLSSISDLSISSTLPVAPSLSSSSVSFSTTAPSYTPPVSPAKTAFNDYWVIGDIPDSDPGSLSISAIPPVAPVINAESSSTGGAEVDTSKLATAPTYTAPVMAATDFSDADTWVNTEEDPEMVASRMQVINGQISEFSTKVQDSLNTFNKENAEYQAKLQIALQDAAQANSGDSTLISKFSSDLGLYQANVSKEVQEYQQKLARYQLELSIVQQSWAKEETDKLQKYQSDIQNELNNFNDSNVEYQAQLQISIQDAQLDSQDESQELQRYQSELQSYQNDVNKQVQEFTSNFQKNIQVFQSENSSKISQYQSDIQNELNEFNKENVAYQSAIQESVQEVQLTNQKNLTAAEGELRLNMDNENRSQQRQLQNGVNDMQAIMQNNDDLISKYSAELQQYQAEVAAEVQEFQQNLEGDLRVWESERQTDVQKYSTDIQNSLNSFNKSNVEYQQDIQRKTQNLQKDIQEAVQNAQNDIAINNANLTKDVQLGLQNALNDFRQDVDEYAAKIQLYTTELQKYQSEIGEKSQKVSSGHQNASYYALEAKKYYEWAITEVNMYTQNNSKMINRTMAAQAAAQQQR